MKKEPHLKSNCRKEVGLFDCRIFHDLVSPVPLTENNKNEFVIATF